MSPGSETDGETADPSVSQTQDGSKRIVCLRQQASKWIKLKGPVIICSFVSASHLKNLSSLPVAKVSVTFLAVSMFPC